MTWDEYNKLFHDLQLNLVAFKPLMQCDEEVLKLVNAAIEAERQWVDLTATEIKILRRYANNDRQFAELVQAQFKEKNNG